MSWGDFHFLRPLWLWILPPLVVLGVYWLRRPPRHNPWKEQVDAHLLPHLMMSKGRLSRWPLFLLLSAWLLAVLALAGPTWQRQSALQFRPAVAPLVIVLDLSRSMDAEDLRPSRLAVAKARLQQLLEELPPRPVGLAVFSALGHSVMPLTEDTGLMVETLQLLETGLMPAQGSRPVAGLAQARQLLERAGESGGDILLVTDKADQEGIALARELFEEQFVTSVWAMGTPGGGLIPAGSDYLSRDGALVTPRLEVGGLRGLAEAGGGIYVAYRQNGEDLRQLLDGLERPFRAGEEPPKGAGERWRDEGSWLLFLLLLLSLLAFRRGWEARALDFPGSGLKAALATSVLILGIQLPKAQAAWEWDDLWWRADQQEARDLKAGQLGQMKALGHDLLWRGIAHYRRGEYELAVAAFSALDEPIAHYNRGNALVQLGRLDNAQAAYERALQLDGEHKRARFNRDLVKEELRRAGLDEEEVELELSHQEQPSHEQQAKQEAVAPYVEAFLEPDEGAFNPKIPDVEGPGEELGTLGGGAVLLEGAEDKEGEEGPGVGQAADSGEQGVKEDEPELTRPGSVPGRQKPQSGNEEESQSLAQPGGEQADQGQPGGGLPDERSAAGRENEGEGQSGESPMDQERMLQSAVEAAPTNAEQKPLPPRQGLDEELKQAMEQWLARIPDEPAGLLREKFLREYRRHANKPVGLDPW